KKTISKINIFYFRRIVYGIGRGRDQFDTVCGSLVIPYVIIREASTGVSNHHFSVHCLVKIDNPSWHASGCHDRTCCRIDLDEDRQAWLDGDERITIRQYNAFDSAVNFTETSIE